MTKLALGRRALVAGGLAIPAIARAQAAWPSRPVRIVVPYAPGGGTDVTNRAYAEALTRRFGSPFIIDNRPGANGIIGADAVARGPADGTSFVAPNITHTMLRHITNPPFDPIADFTPVALLASYCFVLLAYVDSPFRDVASLVDHAKRRPGEIAYGTADIASAYTAAQFATAAGIDMTEVRYQGSGQAVGNLTGGHMPLAWMSTATVMTLLPGGKVRPLAVSSSRRSSFLPETPSLQELGFGAANFDGWFGLFGPARLPAEIANQMNGAIVEAAGTPVVAERLRTLAVEPWPVNTAEMATIVAEDDRRWAAAAAAGRLPRS